MQGCFTSTHHLIVNDLAESHDLIASLGFETYLDQLSPGQGFVACESTTTGGDIYHGTEAALIGNNHGLPGDFTPASFFDDSYRIKRALSLHGAAAIFPHYGPVHPVRMLKHDAVDMLNAGVAHHFGIEDHLFTVHAPDKKLELTAFTPFDQLATII